MKLKQYRNVICFPPSGYRQGQPSKILDTYKCASISEKLVSCSIAMLELDTYHAVNFMVNIECSNIA